MENDNFTWDVDSTTYPVDSITYKTEEKDKSNESNMPIGENAK
jgi:hypothetical protein